MTDGVFWPWPHAYPAPTQRIYHMTCALNYQREAQADYDKARKLYDLAFMLEPFESRISARQQCIQWQERARIMSVEARWHLQEAYKR